MILILFTTKQLALLPDADFAHKLVGLHIPRLPLEGVK